MAKSGSKTNQSLQPPLVRQFSVFLENKVGALLDLTRTLSESSVHVCGISVVDTADASVVRIVVDDPERCHEALGKVGMPVNESNLIVVELPRGPEKLDTVLRCLVAAEVNIQYTYSLMIRPHDNALLALHCEDADFARDVLLKDGHSVLSQKDISR
ncbi:MAG TPA: acetolactate synthase [Verrucomicrobiae bacterium]|nr:acetolactate synthase [Verrucomicrobiae bacterium]